MMAPVLELPSPRSDSPETLLREWMLFARLNKALHEVARTHYARMSDGGLITTVVMGSADGLINILLGAGSATGADLNISQDALGLLASLPQPSLAQSSNFNGRLRPFYTARPRCTMPSWPARSIASATW